MPTKRAKTLEPEQLDRLLDYVKQHSAMPERDRLIVMLSFKAGLRAAEIVKIDMDALTDAEGRIGKAINIFAHVGKMGRERSIPMHPHVRDALAKFRRRFPSTDYVAVAADQRSRMSVNAMTVYLHRLFAKAGFQECSSHSGRRTFGTELAKRANKFHNSLKDVQLLMGHARLDTTERYIEASQDTFKMVASL
jgi:integrase